MGEQLERSWGQAKRFEFVEWRLFWVGKLNRADIEAQFGISTPQASADLKKYQEFSPGNLVYNSSLKAYFRGEEFSPKFLKVSAERYLLQMRAMTSGAITHEDTWFGRLPAFDAVPLPLRSISNEDLRSVVSAVSDATALEVTYRSLSGYKARVIAPHSLAFDGNRWHVRAWCFEHQEFRDFSLSRMVDPKPINRKSVSAACDVEWEQVVRLILSPHPDLTLEQRKTVEMDYGMTGGTATIDMRLALSYYLIRERNLDNPLNNALRQQIVLDNLTEVNAAREAAKRESRRLAALQSAE